MRKRARQKIQCLVNNIRAHKAQIACVREMLEDVLLQEEMSRDNLEEYFSETEMYERISNNCDYLECAIETLDDEEDTSMHDAALILCQIDGIK